MTEFDRGKKTLPVLATVRIYELRLCFRSLTVPSKGAEKPPQNNHQPTTRGWCLQQGMVSAFLLLESALPGSWGRSRAGCCRISITASLGRAQTWLCSHTSTSANPLPESAGELETKGRENNNNNKRTNKVITYFKGPLLQKHSEQMYPPKL